MLKSEQLRLCEFVEESLEDSRKQMKRISIENWKDENYIASELDYYIRNVAFYVSHLITWCDQLDEAVELIINFKYKKNSKVNKWKHFIYNYENYLIRLQSTYDRLLQLTNAVFHTGINNEHVGHQVTVSNVKIKQQTELLNKLKAIKKILREHSQERNTLVHKHSLLDDTLGNIEMYYVVEDWTEGDQSGKFDFVKKFRASELGALTKKKRNEMSDTNSKLMTYIIEFIDLLIPQYSSQKARLSTPTK